MLLTNLPERQLNRNIQSSVYASICSAGPRQMPLLAASSYVSIKTRRYTSIKACCSHAKTAPNRLHNSSTSTIEPHAASHNIGCGCWSCLPSFHAVAAAVVRPEVGCRCCSSICTARSIANQPCPSCCCRPVTAAAASAAVHVAAAVTACPRVPRRPLQQHAAAELPALQAGASVGPHAAARAGYTCRRAGQNATSHATCRAAGVARRTRTASAAAKWCQVDAMVAIRSWRRTPDGSSTLRSCCRPPLALQLALLLQLLLALPPACQPYCAVLPAQQQQCTGSQLARVLHSWRSTRAVFGTLTTHHTQWLFLLLLLLLLLRGLFLQLRCCCCICRLAVALQVAHPLAQQRGLERLQSSSDRVRIRLQQPATARLAGHLLQHLLLPCNRRWGSPAKRCYCRQDSRSHAGLPAPQVLQRALAPQQQPGLVCWEACCVRAAVAGGVQRGSRSNCGACGCCFPCGKRITRCRCCCSAAAGAVRHLRQQPLLLLLLQRCTCRCCCSASPRCCSLGPPPHPPHSRLAVPLLQLLRRCCLERCFAALRCFSCRWLPQQHGRLQQLQLLVRAELLQASSCRGCHHAAQQHLKQLTVCHSPDPQPRQAPQPHRQVTKGPAPDAASRQQRCLLQPRPVHLTPQSSSSVQRQRQLASRRGCRLQPCALDPSRAPLGVWPVVQHCEGPAAERQLRRGEAVQLLPAVLAQPCSHGLPGRYCSAASATSMVLRSAAAAFGSGNCRNMQPVQSSGGLYRRLRC
ncbi:hypothetical protein COO60DRAFT_1009702 [Scenedesmus sp. NREL 46B-D3]|nr:hypothetical protein COO60DRAFT_1009702 [Scenedesmus sp. NREL 46B-D3]